MLPHVFVESAIMRSAFEHSRILPQYLFTAVPGGAFESGVYLGDEPVHVGNDDALTGLLNRHR